MAKEQLKLCRQLMDAADGWWFGRSGGTSYAYSTITCTVVLLMGKEPRRNMTR